MRRTRDEWFLRFGGPTILENTPDNLMNLLSKDDRLSLVVFVWSEFDRICPEEDYFAGTRWKGIIPHVHLDASRFYLREKPFIGFWTLVSGEFEDRSAGANHWRAFPSRGGGSPSRPAAEQRATPPAGLSVRVSLQSRPSRMLLAPPRVRPRHPPQLRCCTSIRRRCTIRNQANGAQQMRCVRFHWNPVLIDLRREVCPPPDGRDRGGSGL